MTLTVKNAYGTSTATKKNYITIGMEPKADFSGSPDSGDAPLTVKFTFTPPTTGPSLSCRVAVTMLLEVLVAKVAGAAVTVMLYSEPELALLVITTEPDTLPTAAVIVSETSVVELFEPAV